MVANPAVSLFKLPEVKDPPKQLHTNTLRSRIRRSQRILEGDGAMHNSSLDDVHSYVSGGDVIVFDPWASADPMDRLERSDIYEPTFKLNEGPTFRPGPANLNQTFAPAATGLEPDVEADTAISLVAQPPATPTGVPLAPRQEPAFETAASALQLQAESVKSEPGILERLARNLALLPGQPTDEPAPPASVFGTGRGPVALGNVPLPGSGSAAELAGDAGAFALRSTPVGYGIDFLRGEDFGTTGQEVGRFLGEAAVPRTVGELALELTPFGVAGDAADIRRLLPEAAPVFGGSPALEAARPAVRVATNIGESAARQLGDVFSPGMVAEPRVIRLGVKPEALADIPAPSLAATRGSKTIADPAGVRVLTAEDALAPGEVEMFHGTGVEFEGPPRAGSYVAPDPEDARLFADISAQEMTRPPGIGRRLLTEETGAVGPPQPGGISATEAKRRANARLGAGNLRPDTKPIREVPFANEEMRLVGEGLEINPDSLRLPRQQQIASDLAEIRNRPKGQTARQGRLQAQQDALRDIEANRGNAADAFDSIADRWSRAGGPTPRERAYRDELGRIVNEMLDDSGEAWNVDVLRQRMVEAARETPVTAPRPAPVREAFRGEQGGLQPGMFTREEAGSRPGQMGLEEGLRLGAETPPARAAAGENVAEGAASPSSRTRPRAGAGAPAVRPGGGAAPPAPPPPPAGGGPMSEGDAVMALRRALREGKGQERAQIVSRGRRRQAARIGEALNIEEQGGAEGLDLARRAGQAGAGNILPEGGIGFRLSDDAVDPLVQKAIRLQQEGKLSVFDAVYGIPRAIDEGRRLGPTPAQARLLSRLTDIDEAEFATFMRQRRAFDTASRESISAEVARVGTDEPALVRTQLQAARRAELNADRAATRGNAESAARLRQRASEHKTKAEALQRGVEEKERLAEIRRLQRQIAAEVQRQEQTLQRRANIEKLKLQKTQREIETAQAAFDNAQFKAPLVADREGQAATQRLISQLQPPDVSPERVAQNTRRYIQSLSEQGISGEQARSALEILDYHRRGNRAILDSLKNAEGLEGVVAGVRAQATGDLADSYLTSLLYRNMALGHALRETGMNPTIARKVADAAINEELRRRYGVALPSRIVRQLELMKQAPYQESLGGLDRFVQRYKNTVFGIDAGIFGVQVRTAIRRGGINMLAGMVNKQLAFLHLPHVNTYMDEVALPKRIRNIVDGVHIGAGQSPLDLREGTLLSYVPGGKWLDDKAVAPALDRVNEIQFNNVLGWAGDNAYEGNLVILHLLGRDITNPAVRAQAADISNAIKSFANSALRSGRRGAERKLLTSSAMTRSQVANLLQMSKLIRPGASIEQRALASTLIASQAVYYLAVGKFLNDQIGLTDFVFTPGEAGFGQITTDVKDSAGRNTVLDMFPQASLEKAIGDAIIEIGRGNEEATAEAWARYFTGRTSVVGRVGFGFAGLGYSPQRGFRTDLERGERLLNVAPLPPIVSSALAEGFEATRAALDFIGVTSFPESDSRRRNRERDIVSQERFGKPYAELFQSQQNQIDADPRVQPFVEGARQQQADRGSVLAQNTIALQDFRTEREQRARLVDERIATQGGQWAREQYGRLEAEIGAEAARLANTPEAKKEAAELDKRRGELTYPERAQADYYDIFRQPGIYDELGNFDFARYQELRDEWQAQYPDVSKEQVAPGKPLSPGHAELEQARTQLNQAGWWDADQRGYDLWLQTTDNVPQALAKYQSLDDLRSALRRAARASGMRDEDEITNAIFDIENTVGITKAINFSEAVVLRDHLEIIPLLERWYDLDKGEINILRDLIKQPVGAGR